MAFRLDSSIQAGQFARLSNGLTMHYACRGRLGSPLVLLLHGFPQFWFAWHDVMRQLPENCFAVAPDLRGYNQTDKPQEVEAYRINRLIEDIVQLISALGYGKAKIIAHDWGGAVAWSTAIAKPEKVHALMILNAPHPVPFARLLASDPAQQQASRYMNLLRQPGSESQLLADNCAALMAKFRARGQPDWAAGEVATQYRAAWTVPGAMTGMVNYYRASPLYPPQGNDSGAAGLSLDPGEFVVRVPTDVIWGLRDSALLPSLLDGLDEVVPDIRLTKIDDATHWLIHEQPAAVCALINDFVSRHHDG